SRGKPGKKRGRRREPGKHEREQRGREGRRRKKRKEVRKEETDARGSCKMEGACDLMATVASIEEKDGRQAWPQVTVSGGKRDGRIVDSEVGQEIGSLICFP
ncbi:hypothetical protein KI387_011657, partial [Taxus chinensis]